MDHKPIAPFEAPAPERSQYQGPLIFEQRPAVAAQRPGAAAALAESTHQLTPAATTRAADRFAGARPLREWPQAWML